MIRNDEYRITKRNQPVRPTILWAGGEGLPNCEFAVCIESLQRFVHNFLVVVALPF